MDQANATELWNSLTDEEREAGWLIRLGYSDGEIAQKTNRPEEEVRRAVGRACAKLEVEDRLSLALYIVYHRLEVRPAHRETGGSRDLHADAG